jgi:glyoxylate reductase
MTRKFRVFATCDIGEAIDLLRKRDYEVEVYPGPEAPPKSLIIDRVKSGIDGLVTTLRDPIDAEVFDAGKNTLKVVAQYAVGFDNINRADATYCRCFDRSYCRVRFLHAGRAGAKNVAG